MNNSLWDSNKLMEMVKLILSDMSGSEISDYIYCTYVHILLVSQLTNYLFLVTETLMNAAFM